MRVTYEKIKRLRELRVLLRKACHAPGCVRVRICPRQCSCRTQRQFELNTDTAICWEIAELLWNFNHETTITKADVKELKDKIIAYAELSRHHSSKGWEKFFWNVKRTFSSIFQTNCWSDPSAVDWINHLNNTVNRLKRYPKQ